MELIENDIEITSLQIAEMTGEGHRHILKFLGEIKESVGRSGIGTLMGRLYLDERGEERPLYIMSKWVAIFIAPKFDDEPRDNIICGIKEIEDTATRESNLLQRKYGTEITSLQIAEMAGKKHKSVLKTLRKTLKGTMKSSAIAFDYVAYLDAHGEFRPMIVMNKWATLFVALKFKDRIRDKIFTRVRELEEATKVNALEEVEDNATREREILQGKYEEELELLEEQVKVIEDKVSALWN